MSFASDRRRSPLRTAVARPRPHAAGVVEVLETRVLLSATGSSAASFPTTGDYDGTGALKSPADTFRLHSNPDAAHRVYLDFDGHVTSGTDWNRRVTGAADFTTAAFDFAGGSDVFTAAEREVIQRVWMRVAEDFLPFDLDVTTEAPPTADLVDDGSPGDRYGVRVVVGGAADDWLGGAAAGIAFVPSFRDAVDTPAYVFSEEFAGFPRLDMFLAETASHEAGHTFGLEHDADPTDEYHAGHGFGANGWGTILGAADGRAVSQWDRGEFVGAENAEDDLAVIAEFSGAGFRPDDHGDTPGDAAALAVSDAGGGFLTVSGGGIIERNTDADLFRFETGAGNISLAADVAAVGPNLNVGLRLLDAIGNKLATAAPENALGATIDADVAAGTYFLEVTGTGRGTPDANGRYSDGYSDYGSLGIYRLSGSLAAPPSLVVTPLSGLDDGGGLVVGEDGTVATFSAVLSARPDSPVVTRFRSTDPSRGYTLVKGVRFTADDWDVPRTITVHGTHDTAEDGDGTFRIAFDPAISRDPGFHGADAADLGVTVLDDDFTGSLVVTPLAGATADGELVVEERRGRATFGVALSHRPESPVLARFRSSDAGEGFTRVRGVRFTAADWDVPRTITLFAADDAAADGNQTFAVRFDPLLTHDRHFRDVDPADLAVTNRDDETRAAVRIGPAATGSATGSGTETNEDGGRAEFTVTLSERPTAPVVVRLRTTDPSEGVTRIKGVRFTAEDWDVPQVVTVFGVADDLADGDAGYAIEFDAAISRDPRFAGVTTDGLALTNRDLDAVFAGSGL